MDRSFAPGSVYPVVVADARITALKGDLQETRRPAAGVISKQRGARVQTELVGSPVGDERPGSMNVSATVEMRRDRGQPASQFVGIDQVLVCKLPPVRTWRIDGVMTGDE